MNLEPVDAEGLDGAIVFEQYWLDQDKKRLEKEKAVMVQTDAHLAEKQKEIDDKKAKM